MKKPIVLVFAFLFHMAVAEASIIVDPGFDSGFTGTWGGSANFGGGNLSNGTGVAASSAVIYDNGWLTFADNGGGNPR